MVTANDAMEDGDNEWSDGRVVLNNVEIKIINE